MDRKGQIGFGFIVMSAVAILIGLALYNGVFAENIGAMTKTSSVRNVTMTMPANGATSELSMCGQRALTYSLTNATSSTVVPTTNYTVSSSAGTDGFLAAKITTTTSTFGGTTSE